MRIKRIVCSIALAAGFMSLSVGATAQDAKKTDAPKETKKADKAKEAKKPAPVIVAVTGADIYTVTKGVIRNGTVLIQDGKIKAVGQDVAIPAGATRIDATGKVVTPGFVAMSAQNVAVRTLGGGGGPGGGGGGGGAQGKFADALNPFDRNIQFALSAGITTACVEVPTGGGGRFGRSPEDTLDPFDLGWELIPDDTNLCPCCGMFIQPTEPINPAAPAQATARRNAAIKMSFGDMSQMLVKETPFYHLPAGAFSGALARHNWREQIKRAKQAAVEQASQDSSADGGVDMAALAGGRRGGVSADLIRLVEKKIPLRVEAESAEQMRDAIALAKELDYNLVLEGVQEAWLIAGELSAAKVQTVITPRNRRRPNPGKEDSSGSSIETSAHLEKAGVPFAVTALSPSVSLDGIPGRDLTSLPLEAAFAIRGGCSEAAALQSLTIEPARMLGLAERIGSIEPGKDGDILILDGPPLDYRTYVEKALVGGKLCYDRKRDRLYQETPKTK